MTEVGCTNEQGGYGVDPVGLVLTALAAGASAGLKDTVTAGVKDAYTSLKKMVSLRFDGDAKALEVLVDHEADPDTYERPLAKQLEVARVADDADLLIAAQVLLSRVDPAGAQVGKYNVQATGNAQIGVIGDNATVTMGRQLPHSGS